VSESPVVYGEDLATEWVPLGLVSPDLDSFTNNLLTICGARRAVSHKDLVGFSQLIDADPNQPATMYHLLGYALHEHAPKAGLYLEFGVASGRSANVTGRIVGAFKGGETSVNMIDGFDTFEGLPETWGGHLPKAAFAREGGLPPPVVNNVRLHKGLFGDTLPGFLAQHPDTPLAFANIDCDLYTGAMQVLDLLQGHLVEGSVIHFHELVAPRKNPQEEMKALHDFLIKPENKGLQLDVLNVMNAFDFPQPVVLRVTGMPHGDNSHLGRV